jgi:hypothetical protein
MRGVVSHVSKTGAFDVYVRSDDMSTLVSADMAGPLGQVKVGAEVELCLAADGAVLSVCWPSQGARHQPVAERRAV